MSMRARTVATAVAAVVLSTAGVAVTASPAAAAMGKGRAQICAKGVPQAWLQFQGGLEYTATYLAKPGTCIEATIPSGTYAISVWVVFDHGTKMELHRFGANPSINPGVKVSTYGNHILDQSVVVTS